MSFKTLYLDCLTGVPIVGNTHIMTSVVVTKKDFRIICFDGCSWVYVDWRLKFTATSVEFFIPALGICLIKQYKRVNCFLERLYKVTLQLPS